MVMDNMSCPMNWYIAFSFPHYSEDTFYTFYASIQCQVLTDATELTAKRRWLFNFAKVNSVATTPTLPTLSFS